VCIVPMLRRLIFVSCVAAFLPLRGDIVSRWQLLYGTRRERGGVRAAGLNSVPAEDCACAHSKGALDRIENRV